MLVNIYFEMTSSQFILYSVLIIDFNFEIYNKCTNKSDNIFQHIILVHFVHVWHTLISKSCKSLPVKKGDHCDFTEN